MRISRTMVIGRRRAIAGQQRPCSITSPRTQRCATDGGRLQLVENDVRCFVAEGVESEVQHLIA